MVTDVLDLVLAAIAGATSWAAIHGLLVRGRVYCRDHVYPVVALGDQSRRAEIEKQLVDAGVPTAMLELEWWNQGRRAAQDITVDVKVPGIVRDWDVTPKRNHGQAAWTTNFDPSGVRASPDECDGGHIKLTQPLLRSGPICRLSVGFQPKDSRNMKAFVYVSQGKRKVGSGATVGQWLTTLTIIVTTGVLLLGPAALILLVSSSVDVPISISSSARPISMLVVVFVAVSAVVWLFVVYKLAPRITRWVAQRFGPRRASWEIGSSTRD